MLWENLRVFKCLWAAEQWGWCVGEWWLRSLRIRWGGFREGFSLETASSLLALC